MGTTNIMPNAKFKIAFINSNNKHVSWPRYGGHYSILQYISVLCYYFILFDDKLLLYIKIFNK